MKVLIVITEAAARYIAAAFLPATPWVVEGGGRSYRVYRSDVAEDFAFDDPDGRMLVAVKVFDDLPAAKAWVGQDIRQREWLLVAGGRRQ